MVCEDFLSITEDDIVISACPTLIEEDNNLWGYYFCIENQSDEKIQLVGKDWNITDDEGNCYIDQTTGFKGEIPELEPGEFFEFTLTTSILASNAVFYGSCKVANHSGIKELKIPTFNFGKNKQSIVIN